MEMELNHVRVQRERVVHERDYHVEHGEAEVRKVQHVAALDVASGQTNYVRTARE
jgi:hypothetical protein